MARDRRFVGNFDFNSFLKSVRKRPTDRMLCVHPKRISDIYHDAIPWSVRLSTLENPPRFQRLCPGKMAVPILPSQAVRRLAGGYRSATPGSPQLCPRDCREVVGDLTSVDADVLQLPVVKMTLGEPRRLAFAMRDHAADPAVEQDHEPPPDGRRGWPECSHIRAHRHCRFLKIQRLRRLTSSRRNR